MIRRIALNLLTAAVVVGVTTTPAQATQPHPGHKHTICHWANNHVHAISIDEAALDTHLVWHAEGGWAANPGHEGDKYLHEGDENKPEDDLACQPTPPTTQPPSTTTTTQPPTTTTTQPPVTTSTTTTPPTTITTTPPVPPTTTTISTEPPSTTTTTVTSVTVSSPCVTTALAQVGKTAAEIGSDGDFWCTDFIRFLNPTLPWSSDPGPTEAARLLPEGDDVVLLELYLGNDIPEHIGIVTRRYSDGSVDTIEGNADDSGRIVTRHRLASEVFGYRGLTCPETHVSNDTPVTELPHTGSNGGLITIGVVLVLFGIALKVLGKR